MIPLIIGLVVFLGIHMVPTNPDLRRSLTGRMGENAYKAMFSIVSLVGLVLIVVGYHKLQVMTGKNPQIWNPPAGMRHAALALMLPSLILLAAAYIPSNIRRVVGHPMLAAVKIWAFAHLLANGDLGSLVLFGSFLAYAVYDRISVKRRAALGPLGARQGGIGGDLAAVVIGTIAYVLLVGGLHETLFGVAPLPGWALF